MTRILILLLLSALALAGQGTNILGIRTVVGVNDCASATGTDAYACTMDPVPGVVPHFVWLTAGTANTGAATLDVGPGAALPIYKHTDGGALADNDIRANVPTLLTYCAACNAAAGAWMLGSLGNAPSGVGALDDLTDVDTAGAATGATFYKAAAGWVDDNTILVNPATSPNVRILSQGATLTPFALKGASAQTGDLMWFRTFGDANSAGFGPLGGYWHEGATIDGVNWLQFLFEDFTAPRDQTFEDVDGKVVTQVTANADVGSIKVSPANSKSQVAENDAGCTLTLASGLNCPVPAIFTSYTAASTENPGVLLLNSGTASADSPKVEWSRDTNDPVLPAAGNIMGFQTASGTIGCKDSTGAPCRKEIKDIVIQDPVTTDSGDIQLKWPYAVTITRISCSTRTATSTVTIQFDERAEATPNTGGTDVMTSALVCDTDSQVTSTFTNAGIAANVPMNLDIDAVANAPEVVRIHVEYAY